MLVFRCNYSLRVDVTLRDKWEQRLEQHGYVRDPDQERIVGVLESLQRRLVAAGPSGRFLARWRRPKVVRGLYIYGGVGRGKTFLMDLFFETLEVEAKRRIHFHRMMHGVHSRLKALKDVEDPLDRVAEDIAAETRVLCFDEFFVNDIGDAMILGRLLDGLFRRGTTLVTTSNSHPDDLYPDGLQRSRFLPAIDLLKRHTDVVSMDGNVDYRLRLLERAGTYLTPAGAGSDEKLRELFEESASSRILADHPLDINGREIVARRCAKGIAWFDFGELCEGPRSQSDYIELARWFPTVIVSGVPALDAGRDDETRRFISMVDEFYDRRVKLILSAERAAPDLYSGQRLAFEFERTSSRLIEMQTGDYLSAPHLA